MKVVILAAGPGTRLWPLSTPDKPKQFQPLINGQSLLNYTYNIMAGVIPDADLYVQTLRGLESHVHDLLPDVDDEHIILIPEHRDTLAETLWSINLLSHENDELVLFKSVDQYIYEGEDFAKSLKSKTEDIDHEHLTLFAADDQKYNSNSGYLTGDDNDEITSFVEKPSQATFTELLKTNKLYRSLFIYTANYSSVASSLEKLDLPWVSKAKQLVNAEESFQLTAFLDMPTIDISSTLFQSAEHLKLKTLSGNYKFLDVGRYSALYELNAKDEHGNVTIGQVITGKDCINNLIINQTDEPLVVIATKDSVVVKTKQGTLTSSLSGAGSIKEIYKNQLYSG